MTRAVGAARRRATLAAAAPSCRPTGCSLHLVPAPQASGKFDQEIVPVATVQKNGEGGCQPACI